VIGFFEIVSHELFSWSWIWSECLSSLGCSSCGMDHQLGCASLRWRRVAASSRCDVPGLGEYAPINGHHVSRSTSVDLCGCSTVLLVAEKGPSQSLEQLR
jgi:hypothetical protein